MRILRFIKRLFQLGLFLLIIWSAFNISLIGYGISQLRGQLHIVSNTRPIIELINDSSISDSIREKIILVEKIKKFAVDSLGLKNSENYTTIYDQKNKPLLWVITASEPYKLKAYNWKFPVLGNVSYKGFFDYEKGKKEYQSLIEKGYDAEYEEVSAWSTLGFFKDPILSNMLKRGDGSLAELIIHEMTHATLYLKSNVNLNENLASVCGEQGAIRFLKSTYGDSSKVLNDYLFRKEDYDKFSDHMLRGSGMLDSLFDSVKDSLTIIRLTRKSEMINNIVNALDTISFHNKKRYSFNGEMPNNSYFIGFKRYDEKKLEMKMELNEKFNGNIKNYLDYLRKENK